MKLYATTTSERASKGQGGNDYLEIDIKIIDKIEPKYYLRVNLNTIELLDSEERVLFIEEHTTKGKKKTDENYKGSQRESDDEAFDLANNS